MIEILRYGVKIHVNKNGLLTGTIHMVYARKGVWQLRKGLSPAGDHFCMDEELKSKLNSLKSEILVILLFSITAFIFGLIDLFSDSNFIAGIIVISFFITLGLLSVFSKLNK